VTPSPGRPPLQRRPTRPRGRAPRPALGWSLLAGVLPVLVTAGLAAQEPITGLGVVGLPALGYDADEGYGFGVLAELHQYGNGTMLPYVWMVRPKVFLTTGGRRDLTLFFDAPGLPSEDWRLGGYFGVEKRIETPYYGVGNDTPYDPALEASAGPDPDYYSFGRLRRIARVDLQRRVASSPLRAVVGAGLVSTKVDPVPNNVGGTLYATQLGAAVTTVWTNFVRAGLVWDSRDRETAPRRGSWSEVLLQWVDPGLGADVAFTRWTLIDRRYVSLHPRLVVANRWVLQSVQGDAPVEQLQRIETSFGEGEGLGGSSTVRGLSKNRYAGKGVLIWNTELRWRVLDFRMFGRSFHVAASGFLDQGRVWRGGVRLGEVLSDLHRGYGGGLHGGMGESLVATFELGTSAETETQAYVGLGYLF